MRLALLSIIAMVAAAVSPASIQAAHNCVNSARIVAIYGPTIIKLYFNEPPTDRGSKIQRPIPEKCSTSVLRKSF